MAITKHEIQGRSPNVIGRKYHRTTETAATTDLPIMRPRTRRGIDDSRDNPVHLAVSRESGLLPTDKIEVVMEARHTGFFGAIRQAIELTKGLLTSSPNTSVFRRTTTQELNLTHRDRTIEHQQMCDSRIVEHVVGRGGEIQIRQAGAEFRAEVTHQSGNADRATYDDNGRHIGRVSTGPGGSYSSYIESIDTGETTFTIRID